MRSQVGIGSSAIYDPLRVLSCENSSARRALRNVSKKLLIMRAKSYCAHFVAADQHSQFARHLTRAWAIQ
jgi:hypothetical protein